MRNVLLSMCAIGLAVGCGVNPGQVSTPVAVSGKVSLADGKPATNVAIVLQPTQSGMAATVPLKRDGSFTCELVPGKYAYFLESTGKNATALRSIPEKYRAASMDRLVSVGGGTLEIKLDPS